MLRRLHYQPPVWNRIRLLWWGSRRRHHGPTSPGKRI